MHRAINIREDNELVDTTVEMRSQTRIDRFVLTFSMSVRPERVAIAMLWRSIWKAIFP